MLKIFFIVCDVVFALFILWYFFFDRYSIRIESARAGYAVDRNKRLDIFKGWAELKAPDIMTKRKSRKVYAEIAYPNTPLTVTVDEDIISIDMTDIMACFLNGEDFKIEDLSPRSKLYFLIGQ